MFASVAASGAAALIYEVLSLRALGTLFGNTAQASALGFAVFFAGLAAGSAFWGRRAVDTRGALITYARLEAAIAVSATLVLGLSAAYHSIYPWSYRLFGGSPALLTVVKVTLAVAVLFPPAFLMGGTVPIVAAVAVGPTTLGRRGARLYAANTAGGATGALAAGFYLPAVLGFTGAYAVAMAINLTVAAFSYLLARRAPIAEDLISRRPRASGAPGRAGRVPSVLWVLSALSGFLTLGLEVAATRLFAQVLQNSVYTFSTILVTFLVALAAGSVVASWLAQRATRPWTTLALVLIASSIAVAAIPFVFYRATGELRYLAPGHDWASYTGTVFAFALFVLAIPGAVVGIAFPFLLRLAQDHAAGGVGRLLGRVNAWNTAGAIAGSLTTGFVLLPSVGLWSTFKLIGLVYLVSGTAVLWFVAQAPIGVRLVPALLLLILSTALDPVRLPLVRLNEAAGERLLDVWESAYGVTAVVARGGERRIKVNNYYSLGGSGSVEHERNQALLPLLTHPNPASVFFLGLGSGITAGAAVQAPVRQLTVAELIPDVIAAARTHFSDVANGLFTDPRARVIADDGRHYLSTTRERFDLIVADLFIPWEAGSGGLYTLEHFGAARARLHPAGAFVQWLPLYQMSAHEFMVIARTFMAAFPQVTVWRGDFFPDRPIVALAGSATLAPLDPERLARRGQEIAGGGFSGEAVRALTLPGYAGTLSRAPHLNAPGPLNTEDIPADEDAAPITQRQQCAG
ncbi:MAG: spermidine synthase, partial [Vicinamibacterales bacterium]